MSENQTTQMLQALFEPGDCFEVRIFDVCRSGDRFPHIESGYFDYEHIGSIPSLLGDISGYTGVYVTLNPVNPALLARANNRLVRAKRGLTTSDEDIITRRWLFVDIDPVRPAGISATDSEKANALDKLIEVKDGLASMGFTEPLCVDSGNGFYLIYRVEGNPDVSLIKQAMEALSVCSDEKVHIDTSVHNTARICRLAGTFNRKGEDMPERPHRLSELLEVPQEIKPTPIHVLEKLAVPNSAQNPPATTAIGFCPSAIDDYNSRGDITSVLKKRGWTLKADTDQQYWWRPDKSNSQHSATFNGEVFYVFSDNAQPFAHGNGYSKFAVYSMLEHGGNNTAAIEALEADGYGNLERGVDLTAFMNNLKDKSKASEAIVKSDVIAAVAKVKEEPKEIEFPRRLYNVPGLIGEIMDYTLKKAAVPNKLAALCGGISAQAMLAGQKVTFFAEAETRTNIYIITLSGSGTGKNQPRNTNIEIINAVAERAFNAGERDEIIARIKGKFASGQGIVTAVWESPSMLFQVDELDKLLSQLSGGKANIKAIEMEQQMMEFYSSSTTTYFGDARADKNNNVIIHEPNMCIFGTATPGVFYDSLNADSLRNGLVGRLLPFECRESKKRLRLREKMQSKETNISLPESIINTAEYWVKLNAGNPFQRSVRTPPIIVAIDDRAVDILDIAGDMADEQYRKAFKDSGGDHPDCAIWGRFNENRNKLALIYACSQTPTSPIITPEAAQWACDMAEYSCLLLTRAIRENVADTPCHKLALRIKKKIARETADKEWVLHRVVKKAFGNNAREFSEAIGLLIEREEIEIVATTTPAGKASYKYKVIW